MMRTEEEILNEYDKWTKLFHIEMDNYNGEFATSIRGRIVGLGWALGWSSEDVDEHLRENRR